MTLARAPKMRRQADAADPSESGVSNVPDGRGDDVAPLEGVACVRAPGERSEGGRVTARNPLGHERSEAAVAERSEGRPSEPPAPDPIASPTPRCVAYRVDSATLRRRLDAAGAEAVLAWMEGASFGSVTNDLGGWVRWTSDLYQVSVGEHGVDGVRAHHVYVRFGARGLWSVGYRALAEHAVLLLSGAIGDACTLASAHAHGWETHRVEVASDFVGFPIGNGDPHLFVTKAKPRTVGSPIEEITFGFRTRERTNTRKRPPHGYTMKLEDKSGVCTRRPTSAPVERYSPTWRENGWDGVDTVTRIEVGASGRALAEHGIRDPLALLDLVRLCALWGEATRRTRLVVPEGHSALRRRQLDPRWVEVGRLAEPEVAAAVRWAQSAEPVRPLPTSAGRTRPRARTHVTPRGTHVTPTSDGYGYILGQLGGLG